MMAKVGRTFKQETIQEKVPGELQRHGTLENYSLVWIQVKRKVEGKRREIIRQEQDH